MCLGQSLRSISLCLCLVCVSVLPRPVCLCLFPSVVSVCLCLFRVSQRQSLSLRLCVSAVSVIPRPTGRGLRCNLRFLPLLYLTGLQNAKIVFAGPSARSRWFSRSKALMRALSQIQSRQTVARATGVKVDVLTAPGDCWIHWPDR